MIKSGRNSYIWIDKSEVTFVNWMHGEPNNQPEPANCIFIERGKT